MISGRKKLERGQKKMPKCDTPNREKVHQKIPQTVSKTTSNASIFLVIFSFALFSLSFRHRSPEKNRKKSLQRWDMLCPIHNAFQWLWHIVFYWRCRKRSIARQQLSVIPFARCTNVAFTRSAMTMAMASLITGRFPKCNLLVAVFLGSAARQLSGRLWWGEIHHETKDKEGENSFD